MKLTRQDKRDALGIAGLIAIISVLHYSTDIALAYFHDIYKILYYIPIILAAFRFGVRGGLIASISISIIYTPHVTSDWSEHFEVIVNRFVEMVIFNVVAFITGKLVESERAERFRYERVARELQASYEKLQRQSEQLAEVEEQLRLADRLAILGELTASLAHEVRNPLGAIKGAAEILRDDYPQGGKNREFVELLIRDVDRINEVIENYLSLAGASARKKHERFDVARATRTVAQILQAKARKEKKHLHAGIPGEAVWVTGDENQYRQVVLNLLLNAFAAVPAGGHINVLLAVDRETSQQPVVELTIKDDGVGIDPEVLEEVFKPFFTTRQTGTGLGLPISKRIADSYGWELSLESEPGKGTTARLVIPLMRAEYEERAETASAGG
ncbi:MAG: ATP-binding protein [candidate division KSB1 bacterium]|nr:ATP-binding protein [candidate division KSB1 bacterium]